MSTKDNKEEWNKFKARMSQSGVTTNFAAKQMLIQDYVLRERQHIFEMDVKLKSSKTEDRDAPLNMMTKMGGSLSRNSRTRNQRRRTSIGSSVSSDQSISSLQPDLHESLTSWDEETRGSLEFSTRALELHEIQRNVGEPASRQQEIFQREETHKRKEAFVKIVSAIVNEVGETRSKPTSRPRKSFSFGISKPISDSDRPQMNRGASVFGSISENTLKARQPRRGSIGQLGSSSSLRCLSMTDAVTELMQLSTFLPTLVDNNESITQSYSYELERGDDFVGDECREKSCRSLSSCEVFLETPFLDDVPCEIESDGKIKHFNINHDEILVDFPSIKRCKSRSAGEIKHDTFDLDSSSLRTRRRIPTDPGSFHRRTKNHNLKSEKSYDQSIEYEEGSVSSTDDLELSYKLPVDNEVEFMKPSNWIDHDEEDDDSYDKFVKPAKWIDHNMDDDDSEEEFAKPVGSISIEEDKFNFELEPTLPTSSANCSGDNA